MQNILLCIVSHKLVPLCELLSHILHPITSSTTLYCDNNATSQLAEDHIWHTCVKHICIKFHYVCKLITNCYGSAGPSVSLCFNGVKSTMGITPGLVSGVESRVSWGLSSRGLGVQGLK